MKKKVLGIYGSPRQGGNTDSLLKEALKGARDSGADIQEVFIRDLNISPCRECRACDTSGLCVIQDDMQKLYPEFERLSNVILATPVFFYGVTAQTKTLIDRCQCMWARKYVLKKQISDKNIERRGLFISVGGTRGKKLFDGAVLTVKYFFESIDVFYYNDLLIRGIDEKGAIKKYPDKLAMAYNSGKDLVSKK